METTTQITLRELATELGYEVVGEHCSGGASIDPNVPDPTDWEPASTLTEDEADQIRHSNDPAFAVEQAYMERWIDEADPSWITRAYEDVSFTARRI